jgi:DNA-binding NtrC family response regulator
MRRIHIVEDEAVIRHALRRLLEREGYRVSESGSLGEARTLCQDQSQDLVISDLRLPDGEGTQLLEACGDTPVLIMTSYASVRSAVEAMKRGAVDYIAKPFDHDEMLLCVDRILKQHSLEQENARLRSTWRRSIRCRAWWAPRRPCGRCATPSRRWPPPTPRCSSAANRAPARNWWPAPCTRRAPAPERPSSPSTAPPCPEGLVESELFGHEKGAFTGAAQAHRGLVEAADEGTLFLDEIGELTPAAQSRLLRVLQDGEIRRVGATGSRKVDVRLVAATHRDLEQMVRDGLFREDLYYRLKVMEIQLPPLRERREDIPELARFLLAKACQRLRRMEPELTDATLAALGSTTGPATCVNWKTPSSGQ